MMYKLWILFIIIPILKCVSGRPVTIILTNNNNKKVTTIIIIIIIKSRAAGRINGANFSEQTSRTSRTTEKKQVRRTRTSPVRHAICVGEKREPVKLREASRSSGSPHRPTVRYQYRGIPHNNSTSYEYTLFEDNIQILQTLSIWKQNFLYIK